MCCCRGHAGNGRSDASEASEPATDAGGIDARDEAPSQSPRHERSASKTHRPTSDCGESSPKSTVEQSGMKSSMERDAGGGRPFRWYVCAFYFWSAPRAPRLPTIPPSVADRGGIRTLPWPDCAGGCGMER